MIIVSLALSTRTGETQVAGKTKPVTTTRCRGCTAKLWDKRLERGSVGRDLSAWVDGKLSELGSLTLSAGGSFGCHNVRKL